MSVGVVVTITAALAPRSRLKGMETCCGVLDRCDTSSLAPRSRLKGIETFRSGWFGIVYSSQTLDRRSRLKGMETILPSAECLLLVPAFGSAFPFEGN